MAHNNHHIFLFFCFISLATIQVGYAINYTVTNTAVNTPGGSRFNAAIGETSTREKMDSSTNFIWTTFNEYYLTDRKDWQQVFLFIDDMDGIAYTSDDEIHVSASYIQGYIGDVKKEITGVIYHEMTHVWQWGGNGTASGGLIEGIADYVRLKAGYVPSHWVKPGQGDHWDQGYDVTARFLDYCNSLLNGFVAELNKKMRNGYDDSYFADLLGKNVHQLWAEYKAHYNVDDNYFGDLL